MEAPISKVFQIPGGIAQKVLLRILVGSGIESMAATRRVPSVRSRVLQIPAGGHIESMVAAHCHNTEQPSQ